MNIVVIDYGMGNIRSVTNAFASIGYPAQIARQPEALRTADRIILPGVGAFGEGMKNLRSAGWAEAIREEVRQRGKPLLGLCLGMQLMATTGAEHGIHSGLDLIPGSVEILASDHPDFRLPHIGWNEVTFGPKTTLYKGMERADFYFVHSYIFKPEDPAVISGVCNYYADFTASVEKGNIFGTQYHPEKSHKAGLKLLANFVEWQGE